MQTIIMLWLTVVGYFVALMVSIAISGSGA